MVVCDIPSVGGFSVAALARVAVCVDLAGRDGQGAELCLGALLGGVDSRFVYRGAGCRQQVRKSTFMFFRDFTDQPPQ